MPGYLHPGVHVGETGPIARPIPAGTTVFASMALLFQNGIAWTWPFWSFSEVGGKEACVCRLKSRRLAEYQALPGFDAGTANGVGNEVH